MASDKNCNGYNRQKTRFIMNWFVLEFWKSQMPTLLVNAILNDPKIILLDEATSAVDSQTEARGRIRFSSPANGIIAELNYQLPSKYHIRKSRISTLLIKTEGAVEFSL